MCLDGQVVVSMAGMTKTRPKRFRKTLDSSIDDGIHKQKICLPGWIFDAQEVWVEGGRESGGW